MQFRAGCYEQTGRPVEAVRDLTEVIRHMKDQSRVVDCRRHRSRLLFEFGNWEECVEDCFKVREAQPENAGNRYLLANAYFGMKEYEKAREVFQGLKEEYERGEGGLPTNIR